MIGFCESDIYPINISANSLVVSPDWRIVLAKPFFDGFTNANRTTSSIGLKGGVSAVRGQRKTLRRVGMSVGSIVSKLEIENIYER